MDNTKIDRFKYTIDDEVDKKLIPIYETLVVGNKYKQIECPEDKMLKSNGMTVEMETFSADGNETGFFGLGRDKDVLFESWFFNEMSKEKEVRP